MKKTLIFLISIIILASSGCAYVNVKAPLDTDLNATSFGTKTGSASTHSVLWLVAWGDAGTKAAADNGGLTVVNHMDIQIQSYLFGLYSKKTVIVYGD